MSALAKDPQLRPTAHELLDQLTDPDAREARPARAVLAYTWPSTQPHVGQPVLSAPVLGAPIVSQPCTSESYTSELPSLLEPAPEDPAVIPGRPGEPSAGRSAGSAG